MELIVITVVVSFRDLFKGGYTSRRVKKANFKFIQKVPNFQDFLLILG